MTPVFKLLPLSVMAALAIGGCARDGYYYDRNAEYREAEVSEPLRLPESRQRMRYQDAMPVPRANSDFHATKEFEAPRPQPLATGNQDEQNYVEKRQAGGEQWLQVAASPASLWPRLQAFVAQRGLTVTSLDAGRGRIATQEATLSVRQGLRGNSSEVRCATQAGSNDQCLEALRGYLASSQPQERSVSLAAQSLSRDDRVHLENADGQWQLLMALGFDRAWSELLYEIGESFDGEGRQLLDQNRSSGEILVEYTPRGDGGGFFGLFGGDPESRRYRLQVDEPAQDTTRVRAVAQEGGSPDPDEARELLDTLASALR